MAKKAAKCEWVSLADALKAFVTNAAGHQGASHIKPLHWYVASRLVVEGGFMPDEITPRPPFVVEKQGKRLLLHFDCESGGSGERTILGGLKTKNVDVVITKEGIGPVIAVSMKGTLNAFRNLTNRMEEAVGDCTNLHISYPALVYGFLQVLRAIREGPNTPSNDVAIRLDGQAANSIVRYHDVLVRLAGRSDVRDDPTKYEAVALALVVPDKPTVGKLFDAYPKSDSPLLLSQFFDKLYRQYDQRFVYSARALRAVTRRHFWDPQSPALSDRRVSGYTARVASSTAGDDSETEDLSSLDE